MLSLSKILAGASLSKIIALAEKILYSWIMTIELTNEQEQIVKGMIATGRYQDDSDVVERALKLIQEYESKLSVLRAEIHKGEDSGDYILHDMEDTIRRARERHSQQH